MSESVNAYYYDPELIEQPETVYRTKDKSLRYYYSEDSVKENKFYIGVTSWMKDVLPTSPQLLNWYKKMTEEEVDQVLHDSSEYGTFAHEQFARFLRDGEYDLDRLESQVKLRESFDEINTDGWLDKTAKLIGSVALFMQEREVVPIAIEMPILFDSNKKVPLDFAGSIDLVCKMKFNGKEVIAIVDLKTGNIWESHSYQLRAYQLAWNTLFPDLKVTHIFNLGAKDWRSKPSYELKNWTDHKISKESIVYLAQLGKINARAPKSRMIYKGIVKPDSKLEEIYQIINAGQYEVMRREES